MNKINGLIIFLTKNHSSGIHLAYRAPLYVIAGAV